MTTKICNHCGKEKDLEDGFYTHPQTADGYLGKCKTCCQSENIKNRNDNLKHYRDYDKARGYHGRPGYTKEWRRNNPEKYSAHNALKNAVRNGKVGKPFHCQGCGVPGTLHAHHDDYDKPLEVRWLCPPCHKSV